LANENLVTKTDLADLKEEVLERIEKTETTLLREFRKWAVSFESRFRANEILVGGFNERLIAVEERLSDIEGKSKT
jgi:hypothetical protein